MSNLSNEQIQFIKSVRDRLDKFCKSNPQISNRNIANGTGYSATTINQFVNDKYPSEASLPDIAAKIDNYLNDELSSASQKVGKGALNFVMTNAAQSIFKIANYAMMEGKIGVVCGVPGCGKTIAAKEYRRRNPTSILIEVNPLVTQRSLIEDLCRELKIPTAFTDAGKSAKNISKNELFSSIINRLANTKRLLIIDEGENLNVQCLEVIRRIQDFTEIGMLISGTNKLLDRLRGQRKELQQLFSRVGIQKEIKLLELGDVKAILSINYPEASKFAGTFLSLSKHNGRYLQHLITLVKKTIQETGEQLSDDLIDDAASSLLM